MSDPRPRLFLVTPVLDDPAAFTPSLAAACGAGDVAAVLLRLAPADERTLVNGVKALVPAAQAAGAAVVVSAAGEHDSSAVAARGGADGVHATVPADWAALRGRSRDGRILGAGGLKTRDDAMRAGEAGADYVLFGEPRPDGYLPPFEDILDRAEWWAEIFETPCVVFAPSLDDVAAAAATGAEFVALGDAVWGHPGGVTKAVALAMRALSHAAASSP